MTLLLAALVSAPVPLHGQSGSFKVFGREQGLTDLDIHCILQDRTGFLWVGTQAGLFRYDGAEFQKFSTAQGLPAALISSLHEDREGTLWVGTPGGLARRDGAGFTHVQPEEPWQIWDTSAIDSTPRGDVYFAANEGLWRRRPGAAAFERVPVPGIPSLDAHTVQVAPDGGVWFGCSDRLCLLENGRVTVFGPEEGVSPGRWGSILTHPDGTTWARSRTALVARPRGAARFEPHDLGLAPSSDAHRLALDGQDRLLVTTIKGIARWNGSDWEYPARKPALPSNLTSTIYRDREGSLWIGMTGGSLVRWLGYADWLSWTENDGLPDQMIWSITGDGEGGVWLGTDQQLARIHADGHVSTAGPLRERIYSVLRHTSGAIWTGGRGGVVIYDPVRKNHRRLGEADGLPKEFVRDMLQDGDGRVWVSTNAGLYRSTSASGRLRFELQSPVAGADNRTFGLAADGPDGFWAGSKKGLWHYSHGAWKVYGKNDGLKDEVVNHVARCADGSLLLAYRSGFGLSRLTPNGEKPAITHFDTTNGLKSNLVYSLGCDARGRIWAGTDAGIDVWERGEWRHLDQRDGLIWDDTNSDSFYAAPDGSVWIGTARGLSRYRPPLLPPQPGPAPIVITSAMLGNRRVNPGTRVEVPYSDASLRVHFAALTFVKEDEVRFCYRLRGLEDRWVEERQREVRFQALDPGDYTFEVMAKNDAGAWSSRPAELKFTVRPPWWKRPWFVLLCIVLLGLASARFWAWRVELYLKRQEQLEQLVAQRTQMVENQKQAIEELLRKTELASKAKSEFLANVSHEIRTPMTGVLGMADMLLETRLDARQREYLGLLRSSAEALLALLNDILDFAKIEAGKLELDPAGFSLRPVIWNATELLRAKAIRKGLDLSVSVDESVPEYLLGDARRLRQVIVNLVGNAVKFTERGSVSVTVQRDSTQDNPDLLLFAVADTGMGIPADKQRVIFEPFGQADNSTTRKYGGTGLGLSISLQLVTLMEGRIWVESEPGVGSVFRFTLPLPALNGPPDRSDAAPGKPQVRHLRVLLAEDHPVNRKIAVALLEQMGHVVTVAKDGREALERLEEHPFDVVLMDVYMPELDGIEATRRIRERERGTNRRLPIVALTALAMQSDRDRCLEAGMDAYVTKPFQPGRILIAIREAMAAAQSEQP